MPQPNKYKVCPTCLGEGKIVNPAVSVWTESDRDADPDGFYDMLAGKYDITCTECGGRTTVTDADHTNYRARQAEHRLMLREQGIYPGHPDYF